MPRAVTLKISETDLKEHLEYLHQAIDYLQGSRSVPEPWVILLGLSALADLLERGLEDVEPAGPAVDVWQRPRIASGSDTVPSSDATR